MVYDVDTLLISNVQRSGTMVPSAHVVNWRGRRPCVRWIAANARMNRHMENLLSTINTNNKTWTDTGTWVFSFPLAFSIHHNWMKMRCWGSRVMQIIPYTRARAAESILNLNKIGQHSRVCLPFRRQSDGTKYTRNFEQCLHVQVYNLNVRDNTRGKWVHLYGIDDFQAVSCRLTLNAFKIDNETDSIWCTTIHWQFTLQSSNSLMVNRQHVALDSR